MKSVTHPKLRLNRLLLILLSCLILVICYIAGFYSHKLFFANEKETAIVKQVIDGDTIVSSDGRRVR